MTTHLEYVTGSLGELGDGDRLHGILLACGGMGRDTKRPSGDRR